MSMIGEYRRISLGQLHDLQDAVDCDPHAVSVFLHPEERSYDKSDPKLQIGKSWHGLHFLLAGKPYDGELPLCNAVLGGREIGEDLGYGVMRYLMPEQVREVAEALAEIEEPNLRSRFDPAAFVQANIYPRGWEGSDQSSEDYFWEAFVHVRTFFTDAAYFGDVMLLYIS